MSPLPTLTPVELEDRPRHQHWLVNTLWGREAVGIIGGEPKCGKSFLALDCCFSHFLVEPSRELAGLFRRRITWDDGAIRETLGGEVAFPMKDCC